MDRVEGAWIAAGERLDRNGELIGRGTVGSNGKRSVDHSLLVTERRSCERRGRNGGTRIEHDPRTTSARKRRIVLNDVTATLLDLSGREGDLAAGWREDVHGLGAKGRAAPWRQVERRGAGVRRAGLEAENDPGGEPAIGDVGRNGLGVRRPASRQAAVGVLEPAGNAGHQPARGIVHAARRLPFGEVDVVSGVATSQRYGLPAMSAHSLMM